MTGPTTLLKGLRQKVQAVTYGSPLYRLILEQGAAPDHLAFVISDIWPGDAAAGQELMAQSGALFAPVRQALSPTHNWLRDLRALGTDPARRRAVQLLGAWLETRDMWEEEAWSAGVLGERLANWIGFYEFYAPAAPPAFLAQLLASMGRQLRHLTNTLPISLAGLENLQAIKGLIFGGLCLPEGERALSLAFDQLGKFLQNEVLSDGGHASRAPGILAEALAALVTIRDALRRAGLEVPGVLSLSIERMVPALKFFRHGDGLLALFNGGQAGQSLRLEALQTLSEAKGRAGRRLPHMGFERVTAGRSLLLVDVGPPPPRPFDKAAHAGLLSFEFSVGRDRLLVNCGAAPEGSAAWRAALAASAAHNALVIEDTNAAEIFPDGGMGRGPTSVTAQRFEQDGAHFIEAMHNGYVPRFGVTHQRRLGLTQEGEQLIGREYLTSESGREASFAVRWHLHPSVQVSLVHDGRAALLRTPSGAGWRFKIEGGSLFAPLSLEPSIYCSGLPPRRTQQLKLEGTLGKRPCVIAWSLSREAVLKGRESKG